MLSTHRSWVKLGVRGPRSLVVERAELATTTPAPANANGLRPCDMCRSSERPRHLWNGRVLCDDVAACGLDEAKLEPKPAG